MSSLGDEIGLAVSMSTVEGDDDLGSDLSTDPGTPVTSWPVDELFDGQPAGRGVDLIKRAFTIPETTRSRNSASGGSTRFDQGKTPRHVRPALKTGSNFKDGRVQVQHSSSKALSHTPPTGVVPCMTASSFARRFLRQSGE